MIPAKFVAFFLVVIIGHLSAVNAAGGCPRDFVPFEGNCYSFVRSPMEWAEALEVCRLHGSFLARIPNAKVNDWIKTQMKSRNMNAAYLGGNDIMKEGRFVWEGKNNLIKGFTDWHRSNPSNSGGNEDCVHMLNYDGSYRWNDIKCTNSYDSICQKRQRHRHACGSDEPDEDSIDEEVIEIDVADE